MVKKPSNEEAIAIFRHIHGDRYDYSKTVYRGALQLLEVCCLEHGTFSILANNHKLGFGCSKCIERDRLIAKKERIEKIFAAFRVQYNNYYDYSKSEYIADNKKILIICPVHGEFERLPLSHRRGSGCDACQNKIRDTESLIRKFKEIHGQTYDYSKTVFVSSTKKVEIICRTHGSFFQNIYKHIEYQRCPKCVGTIKKTNEQAIAEFKQKHGDRFDYSLVRYDRNSKKVEIICPDHGVFEQTPKSHLRTVGCPECRNKIKYVSAEIPNFKKIHGLRYDYSLCESQQYQTQHEKISIKCNKHGVFRQSIASHKSGSGCPKCVKGGRKSIY